jgi:hypothetical protein
MNNPDTLRTWAATLGATGVRCHFITGPSNWPPKGNCFEKILFHSQLCQVAAGAFGAHALKKTLLERGTTESWRTAVSYQLIHSLALLALATREVCHR